MCSKLGETEQGLLVQILLGLPLSLKIRMLLSSHEDFMTCFREDLPGGEEVRVTFLLLPVSQIPSA